MPIWYPDTCKDGQCRLDVLDGHAGINKVLAICEHHAKIHAGKNDADLFTGVLATNRTKNYRTADVAKALGIDHAAVVWAIDADDKVKISVGKGNLAKVNAIADLKLVLVE